MATGSQGARDTREAVSGAVHRAGETASHLADQARDVASTVADRARQMGNAAGQTAENLTSRVGSGLETAGESVREHAPNSGMLHNAANRVADTLESSGRYLQNEGLSGLGNDMTNFVKKNPIPALLLAFAAGVLIARATRS